MSRFMRSTLLMRSAGVRSRAWRIRLTSTPSLHIGAIICSRCPVARRTRSSVSTVGLDVSRSSFAMADWLTPSRSASSACVNSAASLASRMSEAARAMRTV